MSNTIDLRQIWKSVELDDGGRIVLLDTLGKHEKLSVADRVRNMFRLNTDSGIVWQVRSDHDTDGSGPFTSILYKNNNLRATRWIGLLYEINLETGFGVVVAETR